VKPEERDADGVRELRGGLFAQIRRKIAIRRRRKGMGHVNEDADMFRTDGVGKNGRRLCENDVSTVWEGQLLNDQIKSDQIRSDRALDGTWKTIREVTGKRG